MPGIIYLVQPAELVGTNRYKIGCSSKNDLSRCKNGYKNGTRYIHIMECIAPFALERIIIQGFKLKFKLVAGREYFEGIEDLITTEFLNIVNNYKQCLIQVLNNKNKPDLPNQNTNDGRLETNNFDTNDGYMDPLAHADFIYNMSIDNVNSVNALPDINPFGKETIDHILQNRELCLMILRKLEYGVNCLFYEIYSFEKNRNIFFPYKTRDTIATLEPNMKIKHHNFWHIADIIFSRTYRLYSKLYDKYESELTERERQIVGQIIKNYNEHGIAGPGNYEAFTSYLDYMSKDNERLIHNYLAEKQGLQPGTKPLLTW